MFYTHHKLYLTGYYSYSKKNVCHRLKADKKKYYIDANFSLNKVRPQNHKRSHKFTFLFDNSLLLRYIFYLKSNLIRILYEF